MIPNIWVLVLWLAEVQPKSINKLISTWPIIGVSPTLASQWYKHHIHKIHKTCMKKHINCMCVCVFIIMHLKIGKLTNFFHTSAVITQRVSWVVYCIRLVRMYDHYTKDNLSGLLTLHIRLVCAFITQRITSLVYGHLITCMYNTWQYTADDREECLGMGHHRL